MEQRKLSLLWYRFILTMALGCITMLCSARELNIVNSNFNNIGIIELPDDAKIGLSFDDVFTKQSQF